MDTRHLQSFLKIAELRSISRAALSLGISQPSLSQHLLRLEDELGAKLFERTARGVTITDAGRAFEEHARHILLRSDAALDSLRSLKSTASGHVIFAAPPSVLELVAIPLIEAVEQHAPDVSLRLVEAFTANIFGWLEAGKIDMGILYGMGTLRNLVARPLATDELGLIGPPGAFGDATDIPLARLNEFRLVAPGLPHGLRQLLEREAVRLGFALTVTHEVDSLDQIRSLVARGHGYAIVPLSAARSTEISFARLAAGRLRRSVSLVRNPAQMLTHASARIEDFTRRVVVDLVRSGSWAAELLEG